MKKNTWTAPEKVYLVVRFTSEHGAHDIVFSSWQRSTAMRWRSQTGHPEDYRLFVARTEAPPTGSTPHE